MTLGVVEEHRRRGFASRMLDMMEYNMLTKHNVRKLTLHCKVDNTAALGFYNSHGFQISEKIVNYYSINGKNEDAYHLERIIDQHEETDDEWDGFLKLITKCCSKFWKLCFGICNRLTSTLRDYERIPTDSLEEKVV